MSAQPVAGGAGDAERKIGFLRDSLRRLSSGTADASTWPGVAERFQSLRAQYAANPDALRPHVPQLTELRRQYDELLDAEQPRTIDRFHELGEQIRTAEAEREFLRQYFIRRAAGRELTGTTASLTVRSRVSLSIPKPGSDARTRLDELLRSSGRWDEVSQLAGPRLLRALDRKRFAPEQQAAIEHLCPRTVTHAVASRGRADLSRHLTPGE